MNFKFFAIILAFAAFAAVAKKSSKGDFRSYKKAQLQHSSMSRQNVFAASDVKLKQTVKAATPICNFGNIGYAVPTILTLLVLLDSACGAQAQRFIPRGIPRAFIDEFEPLLHPPHFHPHCHTDSDCSAHEICKNRECLPFKGKTESKRLEA